APAHSDSTAASTHTPSRETILAIAAARPDRPLPTTLTAQATNAADHPARRATTRPPPRDQTAADVTPAGVPRNRAGHLHLQPRTPPRRRVPSPPFRSPPTAPGRATSLAHRTAPRH